MSSVVVGPVLMQCSQCGWAEWMHHFDAQESQGTACPHCMVGTMKADPPEDLHPKPEEPMDGPSEVNEVEIGRFKFKHGGLWVVADHDSHTVDLMGDISGDLYSTGLEPSEARELAFWLIQGADLVESKT